jgi:hypothetical protein
MFEGLRLCKCSGVGGVARVVLDPGPIGSVRCNRTEVEDDPGHPAAIGSRAQCSREA